MQETYKFIIDFIKENGYSPSYREIANGVGCALSTVVGRLEKLVEFGMIEMKPNCQRTIMLFVTLPTPNYSKIPQIKRRYSIIHSDEYYVRLFYPAPSVIISKPLSTKEAGTSPSKVWFPASFSHHSNSYGLQNYDNHICRRKQSLNAKFL